MCIVMFTQYVYYPFSVFMNCRRLRVAYERCGHAKRVLFFTSDEVITFLIFIIPSPLSLYYVCTYQRVHEDRCIFLQI